MIEGAQYTYDANNNITQIAKSTSPYYPLVKYEYDLLNQLTKETHYDGKGTGSSHITATYEYTYDAAGNLLSEKKDGVTTKTYTYGDSGWNDLLTKFNGKSISYDAIGNPTSYTSNGKDWKLNWTDGRSLSSTTNIVVSQKASTTSTVNFAYDANGIRTQKVWKQSTIMNSGETPKPIDPNPPLDPNVLVGPPVQDTAQLKTHNYITQNGKIVRETIENNGKTEVLDFLYDEQGKPFALNYSTNGGKSFSTYYYILNLQGDVVKLVWMPVSGDHIFEYVEVASYTYNAWGELLSSSGTMADVNPLRYRGYYYDSETGFYYLQSRYYDPATHRFINADDYGSTGQGFIGTNMFAYCLNNPICLNDNLGDRAVPAVIPDAGGSGKSKTVGESIDTPYGSTTIHEFYTESGHVVPGCINISYNPTHLNDKGDKNPSICIYDSYTITDKRQMREICEHIVNSPFYACGDYGRTVDSMVVEWQFHNDMYFIFSRVSAISVFKTQRDRAKNVDFDREAEGRSWLEHFWYGITEYSEK